MQGTVELLQHHRRVYAVDRAEQEPRIRHRIRECERHSSFAGFRTIEEFGDSHLRLGGCYVVNVLHTLPTKEARTALLSTVRGNLRSGGFCLVDVPSYADYYQGRMTAENRFGDGFIFRHPGGAFTFYRFCTPQELDDWAQEAGLDFDFRIVDHHHWVRIYRNR
jgi:hypothetical protein